MPGFNSTGPAAEAAVAKVAAPRVNKLPMAVTAALLFFIDSLLEGGALFQALKWLVTYKTVPWRQLFQPPISYDGTARHGAHDLCQGGGGPGGSPMRRECQSYGITGRITV